MFQFQAGTPWPHLCWLSSIALLKLDLSGVLTHHESPWLCIRVSVAATTQPDQPAESTASSSLTSLHGELGLWPQNLSKAGWSVAKQLLFTSWKTGQNLSEESKDGCWFCLRRFLLKNLHKMQYSRCKAANAMHSLVTAFTGSSLLTRRDPASLDHISY